LEADGRKEQIRATTKAILREADAKVEEADRLAEKAHKKRNTGSSVELIVNGKTVSETLM
jgi:hypothetical protein